MVEVLKGHSIKKRINDVGYDHFKRNITVEDARQLGQAIISALMDVYGNSSDRSLEIIRIWRKLLDMMAEEFGVGLDQAKADAEAAKS